MSDPSASRPAPRHALSLALALSCLQAALLGHTAWDKSDTADEPYYLATSVEQWALGDFGACDAPALPKWGFAAALRVADPELFADSPSKGRHPLWSRPMAAGRRNLLAARLATVAVTVAAGLLLWAAARRFGEAAGLLALALWAFSPCVLAQGSLATLDAWAAALSVLALWATLRAWEAPTPLRAAGVGAALALAAACKVTTLGALPVAAAVLAAAAVRQARARGGSPARPLVLLAAAAGAAFLFTLAGVYGFGWETLDPARLCHKETGLAAGAWGPLPFAPWIAGIVLQLLHGSKGHLSYLHGEVSGTGWWWFYLAALALKTTLGAQALALLLLVARLAGPDRARGWRTDAAILAFPALLLLAMSLGRAQNGVRYVLPAFPFAMLWAARAFGAARERLGRAGRAGVALALLAGAAESLAVHPHHLMFFNRWAGGPEGGPRYLVHGDDWGQDQRRLGEWQARTRPWRLYYTYYAGDPHYWGVAYEPPPCTPQPGYYALHAVEVHRPKRIGAGCLDWLTVEPPDARIGYSIYLYQVNKERIARLERERGRSEPFWRSAP